LLDDSGRFDEFSLACGEGGAPRLFLDFSRQRARRETLRLLAGFADARRLEAWRSALFDGEIVNLSEARPALHTDARAPEPRDPILSLERKRVSEFAARFRSGQWPGAQGRPLARVVNIGIGGSDLGVRLLCSALAAAEAPNETPAAAPQVVLHATADSWIEIRAGSAPPVYSGLLRAGDSYTVPNQRGLTMVTGNAGGLDILVDGEAIPSLGPIGSVRRNIDLEPAALRRRSNR